MSRWVFTGKNIKIYLINLNQIILILVLPTFILYCFSEFELEYLLLEGHCFEAVMGNPPRGLQFTLGTEKQSVMVDTIVMANLGYFQLKANPGEWVLRLRQGRSAEIYYFTTVDGQDVIQNGNDVKVLISSLRSHVLKVKVSKKPDKAGMDLLSDNEKDSGLWNSISRYMRLIELLVFHVSTIS